MKIDRYLNRFRQQTDGNAAVEFALVIPMVFFLLFAIMEVAMIMFIRTGIESATTQAGRIGKTGFNETLYATREDYIRASIKQRLGGLVDTDALEITMRTYEDFSKIDQPEPDCVIGDPGCVAGGPTGGYIDVNGNGMYDEDMAASGAGGPGAVVVYTVEYEYPLQTPMINMLNYVAHAAGTAPAALPFKETDTDGDGDYDSTTLNISSRVVVQNELFP